MDNFVAIDFETANFAQSSVCSVGMVIVKMGRLQNKGSSGFGTRFVIEKQTRITL